MDTTQAVARQFPLQESSLDEMLSTQEDNVSREEQDNQSDATRMFDLGFEEDYVPSFFK